MNEKLKVVLFGAQLSFHSLAVFVASEAEKSLLKVHVVHSTYVRLHRK